jgi:SAM-dependent methyltransferase
MLAIARSPGINPSSIKWYETTLEAMPLEDASFDVALCQNGIQFISHPVQALREIQRVLRPGGRLLWNVPGPIPELFREFGEALGQHINPGLPGFVNAVLSLHDPEELKRMMLEAGFEKVTLATAPKHFTLPKPVDFLWQYIHSTPMAEPVGQASQEQHRALTRDIEQRWQRFADERGMQMVVPVTIVRGEKPA